MKTRVPLPETGLPGLDPLVNGSLWSRWRREGRVFPIDTRRGFRYIRLKAQTSCRLTVFDENDLDGFPPRGFRVDLYPDRDRAETAHEKERGGFIDREHLAVVTPFPNDPKIPELRHCYRSYRLRGLLAEILSTDRSRGPLRVRRTHLRTRLMAYKPARRAVMRVDAEALDAAGSRCPVSVLLKLTETGRAGALHDKLAGLDRSPAARRSLRRTVTLGRPEGRDVVALEFVAGTSLKELDRDLWPSVLGDVGRELAALHRTAAPGATGPATARRSITELCEDYRRLAPFVAARLEKVAPALEDIDVTGTALIHGDLHAGQILAGDRGAQLIDWDQSGTGPALRDVGGLLAHLETIDAAGPGDAFLAGYADGRGGSLPREEVLRWTARMLFLRLGDPFRRLRPDWPERTVALLDRIETLLGTEAAAR